jgi:hypothetical protein
MHPMQDYFFLKVFHKYYNFICIFICTPICTKKFYSCKMWVLHKPTLPNNHGTSTSSSSSTAIMPVLLGEVEFPSSAPLLLRSVTKEPKENSGILVLTSSVKNDLTLLNSIGAREAPKLLAHETGHPPPIILQSRGSSEQKSTTPSEGSVQRRVE